MNANVRIVGHRGAAKLSPENTLASFARALADGATALECDVHLSADGHAVVMHDPSIERTADPASPRREGRIADLTRAELDEVLLPREARIPSLAQVLDLRDAHDAPGPDGGSRLQLLVEVKAPAAAQLVGLMLRGRYGDGGTASARCSAGEAATAPVVAISFLPEALASLRSVAPEIPIGYIVGEVGEDTAGILEELGAEVLAVSVRTVTPQDAALAHGTGRLLNVWTVNDDEQLTRALAVGADTVTSDDPGWAIREVQQGSDG